MLGPPFSTAITPTDSYIAAVSCSDVQASGLTHSTKWGTQVSDTPRNVRCGRFRRRIYLYKAVKNQGTGGRIGKYKTSVLKGELDHTSARIVAILEGRSQYRFPLKSKILVKITFKLAFK